VKRNPGQALPPPGFRWRSIRATLAIAKAGMADMSKKFIDMEAEVYVDRAAVVKEANKAL
jgi:hypothetical protein